MVLQVENGGPGPTVLSAGLPTPAHLHIVQMNLGTLFWAFVIDIRYNVIFIELLLFMNLFKDTSL